MTLAQLLDGIHVSVDPSRRAEVVDRGVRLSNGAAVRLGARSISVLPARAGAQWAGAIEVTYQGVVGIFDYLPSPVVEPAAPGDPFRRAFEDVLEELGARRPGARAMLEALFGRWVILFLRRQFENESCPRWWLAVLADGRLGRAVSAMHDRPHEPFTLSRLAEVAGMSRSAFAAHFVAAFGRSPMEFLQDLRLARAAALLSRTDLPVKTVAVRVGYSSRSSFTRAFIAHQGVGPSRFRIASDGPAELPRSA